MKENREEFIKARVAKSEKKEIEKLAKKRDLNISSYIRAAIQYFELSQIKNATSTR